MAFGCQSRTEKPTWNWHTSKEHDLEINSKIQKHTCLQQLTLIYYSFFLSGNVMFKTLVIAEYLLETTAGFPRAVYLSMHELITSPCGFLKSCQDRLFTWLESLSNQNQVTY